MYGAQALRVVTALGRKPTGPQTHRARHCLLHVGIAGKHRVELAGRKPIESVSNTHGTSAELIDGVTEIESDRGEYLVIARAAQVHAPSGSSDPLGQSPFERGLAILVGELDMPQPPRVLISEHGQSVTDLLETANRQ